MSVNPETTYSIELKRTLSSTVINEIKGKIFADSKRRAEANILDIATGFLPVLGFLNHELHFKVFEISEWELSSLNL